jgi:hypothetical protein
MSVMMMTKMILWYATEVAVQNGTHVMVCLNVLYYVTVLHVPVGSEVSAIFQHRS